MHGFAKSPSAFNSVPTTCWWWKRGSLYPALHRMAEKGWISAEWGKSDNNRRAKYYTLTGAGRKQLEEETAIWERVHRAITFVLHAA